MRTSRRSPNREPRGPRSPPSSSSCCCCSLPWPPSSFLLWFRNAEPSICMTPGCIHTASLILNSMGTDVDPCTDFYQYACGNWIKQHPIPDDAPSVSNFENLSQDLELALKAEITGTWRKVFDEVRHDFGGWPSLEASHSESFASIERLYGIMVAKFRVDSLFKATVQPDDKNSEKHVLADRPAPTESVCSRLLHAFGDRRRATRLPNARARRSRPAKRPTRGSPSGTPRRFSTSKRSWQTSPFRKTNDTTSPNFTQSGRSDRCDENSATSIGSFSSTRSSRTFGTKTGKVITFDESTEVVIYGVDFVQRLDQLLPQFDKRVIVNYLSWCWFFKAMLRDLPDPFALTMFKFYRTLNLMMVQKLRWHGCVSRINSIMPMATSSLYIRKNFDHEAKAQVEEMIELIMEAFVELLEEEDWLTPETKAFAREKVHAMNRKIGYPDYLNDTKAVDKEYRRYVLYPGDYYRTKFQFYEKYQQDILERIRMPVDRERWVAGAALVNAFYSPNTNEIIFPAGILQPVFYNKDFPRSMNYGGIGVVIGHEITHGFDDRGRLYDKLGNIRPVVEQRNDRQVRRERPTASRNKWYSNYVLDQISMRINGRSTKGENIADNGGLKQAYRAYKKFEQYHPIAQQLPGIWCGVMNDKEAIRKLRTSEHSPGPIRVKGPLSNSADFAAAFQCKPGSPMHPPAVWWRRPPHPNQIRPPTGRR
ncbi:Phosphate-regulating neutral endopeptidase [Aphelenchoides fujianensis]|nr:Phosphate-regulating neutral endopeptidase [Aphelenchoides fujianensis]